MMLRIGCFCCIAVAHFNGRTLYTLAISTVVVKTSIANIYTIQYSGKLRSLDDSEVECPYCSTLNSRETVTKSNSFASSLANLISYEKAWNKESRSYRIHCQFCDRKYDIMLMSDHKWLKHKISYTDVLLEQMKTSFPEVPAPIDMIFDNITGITKQVDAKHIIHICFKNCNKRFYLNCAKETGIMQAYMLSEVSL